MPMTRQRIPNLLNTRILRIRPVPIQFETRQLPQMLPNGFRQDMQCPRIDLPELEFERVQARVGALFQCGRERDAAFW